MDMPYLLNTTDIYLVKVSFWVLAGYFLTPIVLNRFSPVPWHLPVDERPKTHWSAFFVKWGVPIIVALSCGVLAEYLLAYQELFPQEHVFLNIRWELKHTYAKHGPLLLTWPLNR